MEEPSGRLSELPEFVLLLNPLLLPGFMLLLNPLLLPGFMLLLNPLLLPGFVLLLNPLLPPGFMLLLDPLLPPGIVLLPGVPVLPWLFPGAVILGFEPVEVLEFPFEGSVFPNPDWFPDTAFPFPGV